MKSAPLLVTRRGAVSKTRRCRIVSPCCGTTREPPKPGKLVSGNPYSPRERVHRNILGGAGMKPVRAGRARFIARGAIRYKCRRGLPSSTLSICLLRMLDMLRLRLLFKSDDEIDGRRVIAFEPEYRRESFVNQRLNLRIETRSFLPSCATINDDGGAVTF